MAHNGTGMMSEALADASMAMAPWLQKGDIHATRTGNRYGPPKEDTPRSEGVGRLWRQTDGTGRAVSGAATAL